MTFFLPLQITCSQRRMLSQNVLGRSGLPDLSIIAFFHSLHWGWPPVVFLKLAILAYHSNIRPLAV